MTYCEESVYRMIEEWDKQNFWRKESECFEEPEYSDEEDYDYDCDFDETDVSEGNDGRTPVVDI